MGKHTPVAAATMLRVKFCLRRSSRAARPPGDDVNANVQESTESNEKMRSETSRNKKKKKAKKGRKEGRGRTFKDDEDQTNIAQRQEGLLPVHLQDIGQRDTVYDANRDVANDPGLDDFSGYPFCQGKEEEERDDNEDFHDCDPLAIDPALLPVTRAGHTARLVVRKEAASHRSIAAFSRY